MAEITRQADILVVASGHPHTLTKDMAKDGAVIIDVGVNRIPDSSKNLDSALLETVILMTLKKRHPLSLLFQVG